MTPLLLALAALVISGVYNLVFKQAHQQPIHEPSYMVVQSASVFSCLLLLSAGGLGFSLDLKTAGLGVIGGLLGYLTGWSLLYAIGRGPTSVTSATRNLSFVITAGLSVVFLGERLSSGRLSALGLAAGAFLLMGRGGGEHGRPHPIIWLTLLAAGGMGFIHKLAAMAGVSASAFLMCQAGTAHVSAHLVCLRAGGYRFSRRLIGFALGTGTMAAIAMTLGVTALRQADAVVISPILQLGFLVAAPGSFWLYREPITSQKLMGLALGAGAIVLFGTSM